MDVPALRTEIKSWERTFKTENQRNPTVDDIKALPKIAAKYKLYKKLCKETTSQSAQKISNGVAPSTPPRKTLSLPGPSLVPKSRPITHAVADETANPFSPTKSSRSKKILPNEPPFLQLDFAMDPSTPPRKKNSFSAPALELFPSITIAQEPISPLVNSAVKKARKRLRGDLVSPSPKKPRMSQVPVGSGSEEDLDGSEDDVPYVIESPVKASTNGKNFKPIFEEGRLSQPLFVKKGPFSRSITDPFDSSQAESATQNRKIPGVRKAKKELPQSMNPVLGTNRPFVSTKSNFPECSVTVGAPEVTEPSPPVHNRKRSSSFDVEESNYDNQFPSIAHVLLPPSPLPSASQPKSEMTAKITGRDRKKLKLDSSSRSAESVSDDEPDLEVIEVGSRTLRAAGSRRAADDDEDEDEIVREAFDLTTRGQSDSVLETEEDISDGDEPEINLPEDLRNVLHIAASHRSAHEERTLVESLLRGRPGPPDQRGEVWGVGESEDAAATTTDDEWAGEGVPWEVGEM